MDLSLGAFYALMNKVSLLGSKWMSIDASPAEHAEESVRWMLMSQAHPITRNVSGAGSVSMPVPRMPSAFATALRPTQIEMEKRNETIIYDNDPVHPCAGIWLTACGGAKNNKETASGQTSESGTSLSAEPGDAKEAADLYQKLMQKEEDIQSANAKLWEKLFLTIDKDQVVSGDNNNYGDFLLKAIEAAKDQFTADELKILNDGAGQIREIEEKLTALEEKYPDCVKMPGEGESAAAGNAESGQEKFPDFQGKDLDGKEVNSSELFPAIP